MSNLLSTNIYVGMIATTMLLETTSFNGEPVNQCSGSFPRDVHYPIPGFPSLIYRLLQRAIMFA